MATRARRAAVLCLVVAGCATARSERVPAGPPPELVSAARASADAVVEQGREELWRSAVACLARRFFVDRADAASGVVALSYAGEPAPYVASAVASRDGDAAGAGAVARVVQLEARVEVVLERLQRATTSVSARARYTVTRTLTPEWQGRTLRPAVGTVSFGSGQPGTIPDASNEVFAGSGPEVFWPTGRLEAEILSCFR